MLRDTDWHTPKGEPTFFHHGEKYQYVRCIHKGREVTGYLRFADDFVYNDFADLGKGLAL